MSDGIVVGRCDEEVHRDSQWAWVGDSLRAGNKRLFGSRIVRRYEWRLADFPTDRTNFDGGQKDVPSDRQCGDRFR